MNLAKLQTATTLTSDSQSLRRLLNIYIKEESEISLPIASAISANILERANLTLQDLSSAA